MMSRGSRRGIASWAEGKCAEGGLESLGIDIAVLLAAGGRGNIDVVIERSGRDAEAKVNRIDQK